MVGVNKIQIFVIKVFEDNKRYILLVALPYLQVFFYTTKVTGEMRRYSAMEIKNEFGITWFKTSVGNVTLVRRGSMTEKYSMTISTGSPSAETFLRELSRWRNVFGSSKRNVYRMCKYCRSDWYQVALAGNLQGRDV